jgi:hypothetical protein
MYMNLLLVLVIGAIATIIIASVVLTSTAYANSDSVKDRIDKVLGGYIRAGVAQELKDNINGGSCATC